ncbi:MAG: YbaK/EbsC family protein, partial [Methyloceanibacter sp.]
LGHGRYSFAKNHLLEQVLGVAPGAVTPFALINESAREVRVVVDKSLMDFTEVNCHPLENTATTRLKTADLMRFIRACGHEPLVLPLDG